MNVPLRGAVQWPLLAAMASIAVFSFTVAVGVSVWVRNVQDTTSAAIEASRADARREYLRLEERVRQVELNIARARLGAAAP